jgi:hypothetical protein
VKVLVQPENGSLLQMAIDDRSNASSENLEQQFGATAVEPM